MLAVFVSVLVLNTFVGPCVLPKRTLEPAYFLSLKGGLNEQKQSQKTFTSRRRKRS
jgi:hypothetical protein